VRFPHPSARRAVVCVLLCLWFFVFVSQAVSRDGARCFPLSAFWRGEQIVRARTSFAADSHSHFRAGFCEAMALGLRQAGDRAGIHRR
jgi:hypothetical protein